MTGSGGRAGAVLRTLASRLELDEFVINTWASDPSIRQHAYRLIAPAFNLTQEIRWKR
jgi:hypothetical protein